MRKRHYFTSRRAYSPRWWPMAVVAAAIVGPTSWLIPTTWSIGPIPVVGYGVLVGWAVVMVRWWIWRRRHPMISAQERLEDLRGQARWN